MPAIIDILIVMCSLLVAFSAISNDVSRERRRTLEYRTHNSEQPINKRTLHS